MPDTDRTKELVSDETILALPLVSWEPVQDPRNNVPPGQNSTPAQNYTDVIENWFQPNQQ
jgi:uncharacterized metal-binding protein YceD (DUF177 family)